MRLHRTHAAPRHPRWRTAALPSAAVALVGAWISGCSVLYDLSTEQCSIDADCAALGPDFEGMACVQHICQAACETNSDCIDSLGNGNVAWACVSRECVQLETAECPQVLPKINDKWLENLRSPNALILAGMGADGSYDARMRNYDLALTEFSNNAGAGQRPLVMLGCKAAVDSNEELDLMMTHLTQTVKVPAMVSALLADDMDYAFRNYAQGAHTFVMSAQESDPTLATIGDSGLLWHVMAGADVIARPYAPLLNRALAHAGVTGTVRVATVVASDVRFLANTGVALSEPPENYGLRFNDKKVSDNLSEGNYLGMSVQYGVAATADQIQQLLTFKPHVIISAAGREFLSSVVAGVEANWDGSDGQPKPFYILSAFNYNDSQGMNPVLSSSPGLQARLAGVNPAAAENTSNYDRYLLAYQQSFNISEPGYENYYDAAYYLLYAAAAAASIDPLRDGQAFPSGMRRLLGGTGTTSYNVGLTDIPFALQALAVGGNIQLNGTMGPPVWNQNGTRNMPGSVYCIDTDNNYRPDVLRYQEGGDPTAATLVGDFSCIPGF